MASFSQEQELHCQTAFLIASAVDAFDPVLALKEKVQLHNLTEYCVYDAGPPTYTKALVALSSNAINFNAKAKGQFQVTPTVFIAFSNSLRHPTHDVPGQMSMANFLAAQRGCGFPGASACRVHGNALAVLESLPLGVVFNLLGQGYKLVATGFKFGGIVAHLFATRVLLQLQQEVQLARQMGINLTMSLADNKVSSYAFGSPFFATSSLTRAFTAMDLQPNQHVNLHTIWRAGDGAPAFFAAASEMYTVAAAARDSAADSAVGVDGYGIPDESGASLARTPQILAVQEWCRYVGDGVDTLSRCRSSGPSRLLARPLENALLARVAAAGGLLASTSSTGSPDGSGGDPAAVVTAAALVAEKLRLAEGADGGINSPKSPASRGSSITAGGLGRTPSITAGSLGRTPSITASGLGRSSSITAGGLGRSSSITAGTARGPLARRRSQDALQLDAAAATAVAGRPASPSRAVAAAGAGRSRRASLVTAPEPARPTIAKTAGSASRIGGFKANAWRDGLLRLLQVMGDGLGERYAPVGQFWILGSMPTERDAKGNRAMASLPSTIPAAAAAAATAAVPGSGSLQAIEGSKAMQSSAAWLSPGNAAGIFSRWESELDEIERDLMEAFAWTTFQPTVEVRGTAVGRRDLLRESAALDLSLG